jgi:hypothetical protein
MLPVGGIKTKRTAPTLVQGWRNESRRMLRRDDDALATRNTISIWLKDDKVVAEGVVANSRPGYGIGIRFTEMNADDMERLKDFLKSMVRIPMQNLGLGQAGHP